MTDNRKPKLADYHVDDPVSDTEAVDALLAFGRKMVSDARITRFHRDMETWKYNNNLTGR